MKHSFHLLVCSLAFLFCNTVRAAGEYALQIFLSDDSTITCEFAKQPQLSFSNGTMTLTTSDSTIGSWEFSKVKKWNFVDAETVAVKSLEAEKPLLTIQENAITISTQKQEKANLYDTSGKLYQSISVKGQAQIPLSKLPAGVYILKVASSSTKFVVK